MEQRYTRIHGTNPKPTDERTDGQRDRDRILYSSALRRLGGVTQVVSPGERALIHNRLTHSLEVAQIGRGLADTLLSHENGRKHADRAGGLDPFVVEAASLAHDLGHPPFGHVAEKELDSLLTHRHLEDGFEGNAQSFRVVTRLATRFQGLEGLDLTLATLAAMLKYPWQRNTPGKSQDKWGSYATEADYLTAATQLPHGRNGRTLEAALMDWADDIAYAVHDMEDFFKAGLIPLDKLVNDASERGRFLEYEFRRRGSKGTDTPNDELMAETFRKIVGNASVSLPFRGTRSDRASLKSFTSELINRYINAASFAANGIGEDALTINPTSRLEVDLLKSLTWYYVIDSQALSSQRFGQRALIRTLFESLSEPAFGEDNWSVFPGYFRESLEDNSSTDARNRVVSDYIASMTEVQAVHLHQRLTGTSLGSGIEHIPI